LLLVFITPVNKDYQKVAAANVQQHQNNSERN